MSTITFRTDPEVDLALQDLSTEQGDRSQVIRDAILLAWRARQDEALRHEALALAHDEADVAEMRAAAADLADLRAW
jgi:Arc/MetJ-type ribon-helix-helix transcriptional regulator